MAMAILANTLTFQSSIAGGQGIDRSLVSRKANRNSFQAKTKVNILVTAIPPPAHRYDEQEQNFREPGAVGRGSLLDRIRNLGDFLRDGDLKLR